MTTPSKITKRQEHILAYLYSFRFLSRTHIQAFLLNKDRRRINKWLEDLRVKRYIEGVYNRVELDRFKPAIYYSSLGSIRYLKTLPNAQDAVISRLYRDYTKSQGFIDQCLLTADIALQLFQAGDKTTQYDFATASDRADPETTAHFLADTAVSPDLVVEKTTYHATTYHLIQLLSPTLRPSKTRSIIRGYVDLYRSELWENQTGTNFPQVLFVCGTLFQLVQAKKYAHSLLTTAGSLQFDFMFQDDLKTASITTRLTRLD